MKLTESQRRAIEHQGHNLQLIALPDIDVTVEENGKDKQVRVTLKGVGLYDRKRRESKYKAAGSGYVSAWYLDEDYDVYGNESTVVRDLT